MSGSIFAGAVPYSEAIGRLNTSFVLKRGDLISHDDLARVIQAPYGSTRYHGVISAWTRQVYNDDGLRLSGEGRARGIGIMVCTKSEETELYIEHVRRSHRKTKRAAAGLNGMDIAGMTKDQVDRHNIARRTANDLAMFGATKIKEVPSPQAVKVSNVRLFKSG